MATGPFPQKGLGTMGAKPPFEGHKEDPVCQSTTQLRSRIPGVRSMRLEPTLLRIPAATLHPTPGYILAALGLRNSHFRVQDRWFEDSGRVASRAGPPPE